MKNIYLQMFVVFLLLVGGRVLSQHPELYLVTHHHDHIFESLKDNAIFHVDEGRVKVVELKTSFSKLPISTSQFLKPIQMKEIKVYIPRSRAVDSDQRIEKLLSEVSIETYKNEVEKLTSFANRSSRNLSRDENPANAQAAKYLLSRFKELGLSAELHCYRDFSKSKECNVVATKEAVESSLETLLIEAHFDDVGHHQAGADDNASGAAALITIAEALQGVGLKKRIVFLATNGEEVGLNGSRAYVRKLEEQQRLNDLKFVINMDMIGYNRGNRIMEIETNSEFEEQAKWFADRVRAYTNLIPEITIPAWGSDHVPFLNKGIPTVLTIEDWQTKTPCYHRSCDKLDTVNFEYAIEIVKVNLAVIAELGEY